MFLASLLSILLLSLTFYADNADAACEPPECGVPGKDCSDWGAEYQCVAKCCVKPDGGGGGGGGGCPCGARNWTECKKSCNPSKRRGQCGWTADGAPKYWCAMNECIACPSCNATAPTNISLRISGTSMIVNWTPGVNGVSQKIFIGAEKSAVEGSCPDGTGGSSWCWSYRWHG